MISFDDARSRLLASVPTLSSERVPLSLGAGRVLADDVRSLSSVPPFDGSAMDGYAVSTADFEREGPWRVPVLGESRTGRPAPRLLPGTACRIFTGAPVPDGADAVVMQEQVERTEGEALFRERPKKGAFIRPAGQDLAAGECALAAGTRLLPAHLSLLAMLDRAEIVVGRRPRVAILATGDELRAPGSAVVAASVPESVAVGLAALAAQAGARARILPFVGDAIDATERAVEEALEGVDLLLTVGGVSVGDHDVVRPALERAGVAIDFWRVAIKPGKPLAFGHRGRTLVLGLPGNPVSALVTFSLFGLPMLRAMQGDREPLPPVLRARLSASVKRAPGRLEFLRAQLSSGPSGLEVSVLGNQASGAVVGLARANALAVVPPEPESIERGTVLDVIRLSDM